MTLKQWLMQNCRFAQQQTFDFYNPAEYRPAKPVYEQQDQQFWNWVRTENNPTKMNPKDALENVLMDNSSYARTFLKTFGSIYNPKTVTFPTGATLETVKIGRQVYIVDFEASSIEDAETWLHNLYDMYLGDYVPYQDFNKEFWEGVTPGYVLYHATDPKNVKSILKRGLNASSETRGLSNRSMNDAVFTSPEPTSISSYGEAIIEIDVGAMKAAGYMPRVSQEEPYEESNMKASIARYLGLDDWTGSQHEFESEGLMEDTIAFFDNIPPQFLRLYE